jgi:hypothetical protein
MTVDELKIMVTLAGGRLPHYEKTIFKDYSLAEYYINYLTRLPSFVALHPHITDINLQIRTSRYAFHVIKGRWPEAEAFISTNMFCIYYYAKFVIKCRWPEAEHKLIEDDNCRKWYNEYFGTDL